MSKSNWEPKKEQVNFILKEINANFEQGKKSALENPTYSSLTNPRDDGRVPSSKPDEAFMLACAKIGAFLMDQEAVAKQLEKLEGLLQDKISKENIDTKDAKVKTLRLLLEEELAKLGFFPKMGKTFDNIQADAFRAAMAHGLLLKDAILGDSVHGEFTHPIQWLLIAWQQADTNFLGRSAISIFKRLGEEESVFARAPIFKGQNLKAERKEASIWELIADRFDSNDFRRPSVLHQYMREEKEKLPLLSQLLNQRVEKRMLPRASKKLKNQYDNPNSFYHKGQLRNVHEPKDLEIDLNKFRKEGGPKQKK